MLVNEVLSSLLQEKISFSSDDFIIGFRTKQFSLFDLELCGLWLVLYADIYTDKARLLSLMSPRITQLSKSGTVMLYAWPFDENCLIEDYTDTI